MDIVEKLVSEDEAIKGIWCVPKYSNPQGITYSDETVRRFARLKPAAKDFRIYWDNAYCVHHLYDLDQDHLIEILAECKRAGNPDLVYKFCSTSKISFPGSGVAAIATSANNLEDIKKQLKIQTIGYDKVNQLRHVRFFQDVHGIEGSGVAAIATSANNLEDIKKQLKIQTIGYDKVNQLRHVRFFQDVHGIEEHMKKHAASMRPKFEMILDTFETELSGLGVGTWYRPKGGYFITYETLEDCAKKVVKKAKKAGVVMDTFETELSGLGVGTWYRPKGGYFITYETLEDCAKKVVKKAKKAGVVMTPAGAPFPYGKDPKDSVIRISPSFPEMEELTLATRIFVVCVKLVSIEKLLGEQE